MIPHLDWVRQVEYAPFRYAGNTYAISSRWESLQLAWGYVGHNIALLLLPLGLAAAVLAWGPRWWASVARDPRAFVKRPWSLTTNPGVRRDQALNIWLIQAIVAVGPPIGARRHRVGGGHHREPAARWAGLRWRRCQDSCQGKNRNDQGNEPA